MKLLSRYVGLQVLQAMLLVLAVVLGLDVLAAVIDETGSLRGEYTFSESLYYVLLTIPHSVNDYLPYVALVGCLLGLGNLASASEITVIRSAGVSTLRLIWVVMRPALILMIVGLIISEYVAPITDQIAQSRRALLRGGGKVFAADEGLWNREGNTFVHYNVVQPDGRVFGISLFQFDGEGRLQQSIFAERGIYQEAGHWLMESGVINQWSDERIEREQFNTLRWDSAVTPSYLNILALGADDLSISNLWRYAQYRTEQGLTAGHFVLSFWRKLLQPLATASLVLIGVSFIFGPLRESTMGYRIFIGVVFGVAFNTIQNLLGPASLVFEFPPLLGAALPIVVCALLGGWLLRKV